MKKSLIPIKKFLIPLFAIIIIISLHSTSYASKSLTELKNLKIKGVNVVPTDHINISKIKSNGFNTVFLNIDSIRSVKKPYNTNYKALKQLYRNIQTLEKANIKYILCFTAGPGYSMDSKISTIYTNKAELRYFSQMVNEVLKRYENRPNFICASINFSNADIDYKRYYEVQDYLIKASQAQFNMLSFIYNLHVLTFEEGLNTLPKIELPNILVNLTLSLKGLTYPGYGAGQKTSKPLDKNALLSTLEKINDYSKQNKINAMLSIKSPWAKNSEVMLQDLFELFRMIKLDYSLCYLNSMDLYDFSTNNKVIKVITRYNK
jgi:hypothetical protein